MINHGMTEVDYHVNLSRFDYGPAQRILTAKASELGLTQMPRFFTVNSDKTNRKVTFAHMFTQCNVVGI